MIYEYLNKYILNDTENTVENSNTVRTLYDNVNLYGKTSVTENMR